MLLFLVRGDSDFREETWGADTRCNIVRNIVCNGKIAQCVHLWNQLSIADVQRCRSKLKVYFCDFVRNVASCVSASLDDRDYLVQ
jgi:hypothetical protein